MINEVIVELLRSEELKVSPSTMMNINKMADSPTNQEPIEIQIIFMDAFPKHTDPRNHTN
jgi:hypothetical protein